MFVFSTISMAMMHSLVEMLCLPLFIKCSFKRAFRFSWCEEISNSAGHSM